jgi:hypothetical protein
MPVGFPPNPAGPVPIYRVPILTGKGKNNPVIGQSVPYKKQLCPGTGNDFSPFKNFPYTIPSLEPFYPQKPERRTLFPLKRQGQGKGHALIGLFFIGNAQLNPALCPAAL